MRVLDLLWIVVIALCLTSCAADEQTPADSVTTGNQPSLDKPDLDSNEPENSDVQNDSWRFGKTPETGIYHDYLNSLELFGDLEQRSSVWLPFRSVSEIPEGRFILGPFIPENYRQHESDFDRLFESPIQTTISLDGDDLEFYFRQSIP